MNSEQQVIRGQVPSKSNSYKIISLRGSGGTVHSSLAKTEALNKYEQSFYLQCDKYRNKRIKGLFELNLKVFYPTQRPDLDNALKIILDCLQGCKAIVNDRQCVKITAEKFIDKNNARIEFSIIEIK